MSDCEKVLLFGPTGQLGVELASVFTAKGHTVKPVTRADADLTNAASITAAIQKAEPTLVVNAAAYNLVDQAESEPQAAYAVNALAVCAIAKSCLKIAARLVHFSTDYVFNGESTRPYVETDMPHPTGAYGVSKLAGELYAQAYLENALIIRTCGVFGPAGRHTPRGNFPELMLRLVHENKPIRVVNDAIVSPTYAPALAHRAAHLALKGESGIFHIGGGEPITWYDYALRLFKQAGLSPDITPVDRTTFPTAARRPRYSALSNEKLANSQVQAMPTLTEALADFLIRRELPRG